MIPNYHISPLPPRRYQETTPLNTDADGDVCLPTQGAQLQLPPLLPLTSPDCEKCSPQITSRNDMYLLCGISHTTTAAIHLYSWHLQVEQDSSLANPPSPIPKRRSAPGSYFARIRTCQGRQGCDTCSTIAVSMWQRACHHITSPFRTGVCLRRGGGVVRWSVTEEVSVCRSGLEGCWKVQCGRDIRSAHSKTGQDAWGMGMLGEEVSVGGRGVRLSRRR